MTTKSFKEAINSIARPEVRGIGKSLTSDPGAECCPICWSKDFIFIAHHWEFDAEILKCTSCSHHSVRTVSPEIMKSIGDHKLFEHKDTTFYENALSQIIKDLFSNKTQNKSSLNILLPTLKCNNIINSIEKKCEPRARQRYKNVRQRKSTVGSGVIPDRQYYGLLSLDKAEDASQYRNTKFQYLDIYPKSYSFIKRSHNIAQKISSLSKSIGKFDMIIADDILSQVIDPEIIVDAIISNCDYFVILVPRTTSSNMNLYASNIASDLGRIQRKTQRPPNYPVKPHVYLEDFCWQQIQFFSETSLYNLVAQRYDILKDGNLPKGKARALKTCRIVGVSEKYIVAHNIPERFYESF